MNNNANFLTNFFALPEKYALRTLGTILTTFALPIPYMILMSQITQSNKLLCLSVWLLMFSTSIVQIKKGEFNRIRDSFEGAFCCFASTFIYFQLHMSSFMMLVIFINLSIFCIITSLRSAVSISLFQVIVHLLINVFYFGIGGSVFSHILFAYIICGIIMGSLGSIQRSLFEKTKLLDNSRLDTVKAFVEAIEAKDKYTCGHSMKVSQYSIQIAQKLGLSKDEIKDIEEASLLHDIGKIGINDSILNKVDKLTLEEYEQIKTHPVIGSKILGNVKNISRILPYVQSHHEKVDGTGYPNNLKDNQIPIGAKIICVADAYEAMTSDRPYRKALSSEQAKEELRKGRNSQFCSEIVDTFLSILDDSEAATIPILSHSTMKIAKRKTLSDRFNINTLNKKVVFGLTVIGLIPILLGMVYITGITVSTIENLDADSRTKQTRALYQRLNERNRNQEKLLIDYAYWDETYEQIDKKDSDWLKNNITDWLPHNFNIGIILILDTNNKIVASYNREFISGDVLNFIASGATFPVSRTGICNIKDNPYIISVSPILKNDGTGPAKGSFMIGTKLDNTYLESISNIEALNINYISGDRLLKEDKALSSISEVKKAISGITEQNTHSSNKAYLQGELKGYSLGVIPQSDIVTNESSGYYLINYSDGIAEQSEKTIAKSTILIVSLVIVLILGLMTYFYYLIVLPIKEITEELCVSVNTLTPLKEREGNDEISTVVDKINILIKNSNNK